MTQNKGKVWLVGAGPSDAGLFTLKGKRVLEQADVVVYDKLVGQGVMAMIPAGVRKISVGKEAGHHPIPQNQINEILLKEALAGNRVVRLKGGDPFVFGRGGEELELLCEHGIPFEIVPGVTSAVSVPAYNGIPVTHRDCCSSVHIITGHTKKSAEADIDYEALVRLKGTLVFLMGVTAMPKICQGLMDGGMASDMPAAILERGTTAHQRRVVSDIAHLPAEAEKAKIKTPAIIVVGEVCGLADRFHWAEDRPLGSLKIAVTRPKDRSSSLAKKLEDLGAEVVLMPTIETIKIENNRELYRALDIIEDFTWAVFTSVAGVRAFYETMAERKQDIRTLAGLKFAAIGSATKRAIEEKGILVDLMPDVYSGKALGELLAEKSESGDRILIPRARMGTDEVIKPLQQAGRFFEDIPVYDTEEGMAADTGYDESVDYVAFTSASTVRGFVKLNPDLDHSLVKAVCIGEQTAAEAAKYGMQITIAKEATIDSMAEPFRGDEPMILHLLPLVLGFLLDLLIGDPYWMPHPVRLMGKTIEVLEKLLRKTFPDTEKGQMAAGTVLAIALAFGCFMIPLALLMGLSMIHPWLAVGAETIMCYQILAVKSLKKESMKVYDALAADDVEDARRKVSMIVGRDTEHLNEAQIAKAAVETVAENTSDGTVAPMIFMAIGGAPLGFFYKAINTMDSMIGYKNDAYLYFGRFAAKLDDLANFIPARVSAFLMMLAAVFCRMDGRNAWKIFWRDRFNHASPNSAQTEAVCAGALRVQLAGDAYYFGKLYPKKTIGDPLRPINYEDIAGANRLLYGTAFLSLILCLLIRLGLFYIGVII